MAAVLVGSPAAAAPDVQTAVTGMFQAYVAAWDRADARALGAQFTVDGDFINPTGFYARGPGEVEAFYRGAFSQGYAGSKGGFSLKGVRVLAKDIVAVDGVWSIEGARTPDGAPRPAERGIATAIMVRQGPVWRVALLREQSSAQTVEIPARPAEASAAPLRPPEAQAKRQ
jgi:uncharacterized protein (TIGR02246 family)